MPTGLIVLKDTVLMEAYKGGRGLNALILINLRIYTTLYFDHFTTWASKSAKNFTLCIVIPPSYNGYSKHTCISTHIWQLSLYSEATSNSRTCSTFFVLQGSGRDTPISMLTILKTFKDNKGENYG